MALNGHRLDFRVRGVIDMIVNVVVVSELRGGDAGPEEAPKRLLGNVIRLAQQIREHEPDRVIRRFGEYACQEGVSVSHTICPGSNEIDGVILSFAYRPRSTKAARAGCRRPTWKPVSSWRA